MVYFLSDQYKDIFGTAQFYLMMSLKEMGYNDWAERLYLSHKGDWYQLFKQWNIYWKHIVYFSLVFRELYISEYYEIEFQKYYENEYVQLLELFIEEDTDSVVKSNLFIKLSNQWPLLKNAWITETKNKH